MSNPSGPERPTDLTEEAVGQSDNQASPTGKHPDPPDPNREPGDDELFNEDSQGNVFYDKNTEIKRETEFHDATGAPIGRPQKVTPASDEFGQQGKK